MTDFQSEQIDYDTSGDRPQAHLSSATIPVRHRSLKFANLLTL